MGSKPHLASLAGFVRDLADVHVLELDRVHEAGQAVDDVLAAHLGAETVLVGISCWTSLHYLGAVEVARRVRKMAPRIPIVVGGHHPTAVPGDFLREGVADFVVRGDGEHALRALCEALPRRPACAQIICGRPFSLAGPGHIDWAGYAARAADPRVLWLELSRGCPFGCSFCVEPGRGARWSAYPVDTALDILEGLARTHAPRVVCFSDALFGANRSWTEAFVSGLEERRLPLLFWAQTRGDLMTRELLERVQRCGFKLDFGLDTASVAMVARMVKSRRDPERYLAASREILEHANRIGLHHDLYLIFNFPGETPGTARETRAFVESLGKRRRAMSGFVSSQSFFILPGTEVYARMDELAARHGTEIRHPFWWRERREQHALATDVLPSSAWAGREQELLDFQRWQQQLNENWIERYPADVHLFRSAFHGRGGAAPRWEARTTQVGSAFA
jgi:radical SAM superfamily enzyme YgiQ (UPF0313 family)